MFRSAPNHVIGVRLTNSAKAFQWRGCGMRLPLRMSTAYGIEIPSAEARAESATPLSRGYKG
jgi:hypothetical protein